MKVYAHFLGNEKNNIWKCSKDGFQYRWRTLLQFGDSWEIIGSVFMKNPGSAKPTNIILTDEEKLNLKRFDEQNDQWYIFSSDNTMQLIEKLFIAKNKGNSLNGIIQIFNLFNIRDADVTHALDSNEKSLESINTTTEEDIKAMRESKAPIYLGWGGLGSNPKFVHAAKKIFDFVYDELNQKYLWQEFYDNSFYHPQYLMGRGKNRQKSQWLLQAFCENRTDVQCEYVYSPQRGRINSIDLISEAKKILPQNDINQWYEKLRYRFCSDLQATFDKDSINIRFFHPAFARNFVIANYDGTQQRNIIDIITKDYGFKGPETSWIGRKQYFEYGNDVETIINAIKEELASIVKKLLGLNLISKN